MLLKLKVKKKLIRFFVKKGEKRLIKGITDFCPVCHDKLRTHNAKRYVDCIEKLIEKGSHETNFKIASHERN